MTRLPLLMSVLLAACGGGASGPDAGGGAGGGSGGGSGGGTGGAAPRQHYVGFQGRENGFPQGKRVLGVGTLETRVYAASEDGVVSLDFGAGELTWVPDAVSLGSGEKVTSLARFSGRLALTVASSTGGGLFTRAAGGAWVRSSTAPSKPTWALVQKGALFLLATTEGISTASSLDGPWTKKGTTTPAFFARPITRLVGAPAQQRLFLAGDPASGFGGLYVSDDEGATWRAGFLRGDVLSLAASGAVVLVEVTTDGQRRSDNYGATFHPMQVGAGTGALLFVGAEPWAGTTGGLRTSADLGVTWQEDPHGLPGGTAVRGLFASSSTLVADTFSGPFVMSLE